MRAYRHDEGAVEPGSDAGPRKDDYHVAMAEMWVGDLPSFHNPPAVEVAVGIEFLQLPGLGAVRLVGLHELWRDEFPKIQEQPALPPSAAMGMQGGFFQISGGLPPLRVWMLNDGEDELLQVQNDRLFLNWRRSADGDRPYPRYDHLRDVYQRVLAGFRDHIEKNDDVGTFQPHTAVVTYVNRFALYGGESLKDAFSPLNPNWDAFPDCGTEVRQHIPLWAEDIKVGQINTLAAMDASEQEYGYLEVVTRIDLGAPGLDTFGALDFAHEAGVRSFEALTTPRMHERWGKI